MSLRERITDDMKTAMKSRDAVRLGAIRFLLSEVKYAEIAAGKPLTDDDITQVVTREIKRRRDSIEKYKEGGRSDLVDKETADLNVLLEYVPEQLSEEEIIGIAREVISELHAVTKADKGKVMSALMQRVRGKADGKMVGKVVDDLLSGDSA